jgi:opacity protein-like surface antigen
MIKTIAVAALLATLTLPAVAADLLVTPDVPAAAASFNWEGAYVGGFLGAYPTFGSATIGGEVGYNTVVNSNILLGVEGSGLFYLDGSGDSEFFVHGKAGVTLDKVALYGISGIGTYNFGSITLWDIGAGAEVALTDHLTLDGQLFGREEVGFVPDVPHIQVGLRYHF